MRSAVPILFAALLCGCQSRPVIKQLATEPAMLPPQSLGMVQNVARSVIAPPAVTNESGLFWIDVKRFDAGLEHINLYCRTGRPAMYTVWQSTNLAQWDMWVGPDTKANRPVRTDPETTPDGSYLLTWFDQPPTTQRFFKVEVWQ